MGKFLISSLLVFLFLPLTIIPVAESCDNFSIGSPTGVGGLLQVLPATQFQECYGNSKPEIDKDELDSLFQNAKTDPLTHMQTPEIFCLQRAYVLMGNLYEKGYKPRLLHLKESPTLIGLVSFNSEEPTNYYDYHGEHWVVAIDVKLPNGKTEPQILDPQFAERPMPYKEYFQSITGQSCVNGEATKSPWECNFEEITPNSVQIPEIRNNSENADLAVPVSRCEWPLRSSFIKIIKSVGDWRFTTGKPIPPDILKLKDREKIQAALVRLGYEHKMKEIKDSIKLKENFIAAAESAPYSNLGASSPHVHILPATGGGIVVTDEQIEDEKKNLEALRKAESDYSSVISKVRKNVDL